MVKAYIISGIIILIAIFMKKAEKDRLSASMVRDYAGKYQAKKIFTSRELNAYKKLKPIADKNRLILCPKVRLIDIVEPKYSEKNKGLKAKVIQKHIDFVVCNENMDIIGVLELDDSTHDRKDRQERDLFVDTILRDVGYTVVHTRMITEDTLNPFLVHK